MRYMWICAPWLSPIEVLERMERQGFAAVTRLFRTSHRSCQAFITSDRVRVWAFNNKLNDPASETWAITACNKQYVRVANGGYLGCMSEVTSMQADMWRLKCPCNWSIHDTTKSWIPVEGNPNKVIPTGMPGALFPKQNRPWPLPDDKSYTAWKAGVIEKVTQVLADEL